MKKYLKPALVAGVAMAAATAAMPVPAMAQVNGMATSNPTVAMVRSTARNNAYGQINTTYAAQIQQINQLSTEIEQLQVSLDTNKDGQLTEAEVAANPNVVKQIQAKEQQAATATQPIALAQYYVVEQLMNDYANARNQVLQAKKVSVLIAPDALQYAPEGFDLTDDIVAAINQRLPAVSTAVPAGWQPQRRTVEMHGAIQQILMVAAQQAAFRQQQQQQQQPAAAPSGR